MSEKYEFIDAETRRFGSGSAHAPSIVKMCGWLEVSRSGFYDWRTAPASATASGGVELRFTCQAFDESDETYGYRRIHADLLAWGVPAGRSWCAPSCVSWAWCPASPGRGGSA